MTFVVDASVTMAWCFEDESTEATDAVLDMLLTDTAVVPGLWPLEVANVLLVAERRGRVTAAQAARFVELLGQLPVAVDPTPPDVGALLAAGRERALSAYNAAYLVLAERHGVPLATVDDRLAGAAKATGVPVFGSVR